MKTIFLDIDGVLDIFNSRKDIQDLLPFAMERLQRIVLKTEAKIVVISTWRYGSPKFRKVCERKGLYQAECANWDHLMYILERYGLSVFDVTAWDEKLVSRAEEITEYLRIHPEVEAFVILDDCFQDTYEGYPDLLKRLVFVDALTGLSDSNVDQAITCLGKEVSYN